jgi:hypothetical protein
MKIRMRGLPCCDGDAVGKRSFELLILWTRRNGTGNAISSVMSWDDSMRKAQCRFMGALKRAEQDSCAQ